MNQETMPVDFNPAPPVDIKVELDEAAKKKAAAKARFRERMADREAYEKLGMRVMKLKLNTYRLLKRQIDQLGIKTIGHCSLMIAREKAESIIADLDGIAKEMEASGDAVDRELRVAMRQLKLDCIKVMVDSSAEHLRAERQQVDNPSSGMLQLPFPAGTPIAVAIGQKQEKPPDPIEDAVMKE